MTPRRKEILVTAHQHPLGLVDNPYHIHFERVAWNASARKLAQAGLLKASRHGGWEITEYGRKFLEDDRPVTFATTAEGRR